MKTLFLWLVIMAQASSCYAWGVLGIGGSVPTSTDITLGITTITAAYDTAFSGAGEVRLFRVQATGTGSVSQFYFYQYGNANWIGVIYSDNAGEPDTLLATTASNSGHGFSWAWDSAELDAAESITSDNYYWVGVQVATTTDFFYYAKQSGTAKSYTTTFGSPPSTWPTGDDTNLGGAAAGGVMYAD